MTYYAIFKPVEPKGAMTERHALPAVIIHSIIRMGNEKHEHIMLYEKSTSG
jgi:hypothetical protein